MTRFTVSALAAAALALAACSSSKQADLPPAAPVVQPSVPSTGGVGAAPGSEQDFMLNVGRRVFFAEGSAALDGTARTTIRNGRRRSRALPMIPAVTRSRQRCRKSVPMP